jgi:hypothetical protein
VILFDTLFRSFSTPNNQPTPTSDAPKTDFSSVPSANLFSAMNFSAFKPAAVQMPTLKATSFPPPTVFTVPQTTPALCKKAASPVQTTSLPPAANFEIASRAFTPPLSVICSAVIDGAITNALVKETTNAIAEAVSSTSLAKSITGSPVQSTREL